MHMVICVIVRADEEEEALEKAKEALDTLVGRGDFDYYTTFDENGHGVAGKDRWGELPVVASIETEEGKKLLEEGLKNSYTEFKDAIGRVRKLVERYTDDEIFEQFCLREEVAAKLSEERDENLADLHSAHYWLASAGMYHPWDVYLWSEECEKIVNKNELNFIIEAYKKKNKKVFVVPSDVHY